MASYPTEIALPFKFDTNGGVAKVQRPSDILQQHVLTVVSTFIGERVMNPLYGTLARAILFDPNNADTIHRLTSSIEQSLSIYEPNVQVVSLNPLTNPDPSYLIVELVYRYKDGKDTQVATLDVTGLVKATKP